MLNSKDEQKLVQKMDQNIAQITSEILWRHGAIEVNRENPFQLSNGDYTPIYINCRLLISYPETRDILMSFVHYICSQRNVDCDCVAGGETGGMPFGSWVAERMDKPFVYVRKKTKGHGGGLRVEGVASGKVLLVEDLITDGGSKMGFIQGIREAGCTVSDCVVLVDREQQGLENLAQEGVIMHTLVGIASCLEEGRAIGLLSSEDLSEVNTYLEDASAWHRSRGLKQPSKESV